MVTKFLPLSLALALPATAAIQLAPLFQDGAVLQRDIPVPIWGKADPSAKIEVHFANQTKTVTADAGGRWMVTLDSLKTSNEGRALSVKENGGTPMEVKDVLVGEVWLASGQSNMQWAISQVRKEDQEAATAGPISGLRLFQVPRVLSPFRKDTVDAKWTLTTPETARGFSAVGYFFGRKLKEELKDVPVGIIHSSWGGSRIEPWLADEGFAAAPELAALAKERQSRMPGFPDYDTAFRGYLTKMRDWANTADKAVTDHTSVPDVPTAPATLKVGHAAEIGTYQAMIHPLVPYGLRGFLWYQGESNVEEGMLYSSKMKVLIDGWRKQFHVDKAPFLYVQLAPFQYPGKEPSVLARLWTAQQSALAVPNTGMAIINDIGNPKDIHPTNKSEVGRRLALLALADTYGQKNLVKSGPLYTAFKPEGSTLRVAFRETGSGLTTRDNQSPNSFEIAGDDDKFSPAEAAISPDGKTVVLRSAQVPQPTRARFAWSNVASPNLMNKEGLPAAAFHTHWPIDPTLGRIVSLNKPMQSSDPNPHNWNSGLTDGTWGNTAGTCYATNLTPKFPKTVTVDLGEAQTIQTIRFGTPAIGATKTVAISISTDGKNFTEIGKKEFAPKVDEKEVLRFGPQSARYIRATFLDSHPKQDNFDPNFGFLSELEAYAPAAN